MSRKSILLLAVFVAVLVVAFSYAPVKVTPGGDDVLVDASRATPHLRRSSSSPSPTAEAAAVPARATVAGPDPEVLLEGLSIEHLMAKADKGDARAGCRVARLLYDCAVVAEIPPEAFSRGMSRTEMALERSRDVHNANVWAHVQLEMFDASERCKGVRPEALASMHSVLRRAALAGNKAAMLKYASGEFLGVSPGLEATRHPGYEDWKREAHGMLLRSLRSGSLEAAFALSSAYRSDDGAIESLIPNDPVEAHVYKFLFHLAKGETPGTIVRLTPAQRGEALRRARDLHSEIFANGLAKSEQAVLGPTWLNAGEEVLAEPCF